MEWISIKEKEKIPVMKAYKDVWVTDGNIISQGGILNGRVFSEEGMADEEITHWISIEDVPLPEKSYELD